MLPMGTESFRVITLCQHLTHRWEDEAHSERFPREQTGRGLSIMKNPWSPGHCSPEQWQGCPLCLRGYQRLEMLFLSRSLVWESQVHTGDETAPGRTQYLVLQMDSYKQVGYSKTPARGWPRGTWEHVQASPKVALAVILSEAIAVRKSPTDLRMAYSWGRPPIGRVLCHF